MALVDIDPQGSLTGWMRLREHRQREAPELRFSMIGGWRLGVELDRLKREAEHDRRSTRPPHTEIDAKAAIRGADLVLVPCQPSSLDIWASQATVEQAAKERRKVAHGPQPRPAARPLDRGRAPRPGGAGRPVPGDPARQPAGLRHQHAPGLGVVESEARSAAADEVRALAEDVAKRLG